MAENPVQLPKGQPALRVMPMPADVNQNGDVFGGWIMAQVDVAGAIPAMRRARGRVATVSVNSFLFKQPVSVGMSSVSSPSGSRSTQNATRRSRSSSRSPKRYSLMWQSTNTVRSGNCQTLVKPASPAVRTVPRLPGQGLGANGSQIGSLHSRTIFPHKSLDALTYWCQSTNVRLA
jgi:hypothetical protein